MLASCQKQEITIPESETVNMVITASQSNDTKTILGNDGKVKWNATGEKIKVCQVYDNEGTPKNTWAESTKASTTDGYQTMNFNVSFTSVETADSFDYLAIYPSSSVAPNSNTNPAELKIIINAIQTPTSTSYDGTEDILVAQAKTGLSKQPSELSFAFKRMSSVGKMTITNLSSNENVKKIRIKSTGKTLTGRSKLNLNDASVVEYGYSGQGIDYVELDYSEQTIKADGMTAYFCVWPFEIRSGESFTVSVFTETQMFEKIITKAPKNLTFTEGKATSFSVDFSDVVAKEVPVIKLAWEGYTTEYTVGDTFLKDGTVTATFDNYDVKDVSKLATFSTPDMSTTGEKVVTVTYGGKSTTGTIKVNVAGAENGSIVFGTNKVAITSESVKFEDNLKNSWIVSTEGTTSFTTQPTYSQIGASKKPATSITFVGTLPASKNVKSVTAKFGGFSGTAGKISIKVGDAEVGTGTLNEANDITVKSTKEAAGTTITITITGIAKGVKAYSIDYSYTD